MEPDDADLIRALQRGDEHALKELVRRHQAALYRFVWRTLRDHAQTASLCQRVFLDALFEIRDSRVAGSFRARLYAIAMDRCRDHSQPEERARPGDLADETPPSTGWAVDEKPEPVQNTRQWWAAVEALPPAQRQVVELRFYDGCTFAEIAEAMASTPAQVKTIYFEAIKTLCEQVLRSNPWTR
jgi:RNA polymerase sigma-70 factor (ECF subfamily)